MTTTRGEQSPNAKLTEADVRRIRERREAGESYRVLAREHGVTSETIARICRRDRGGTSRDSPAYIRAESANAQPSSPSAP